MAPRILILGGGSGGLLVAEQLWHKLDPHEAEIVIVDKKDKHVFLAGLPWVAVGYRKLEDITAPLKVLEEKRGIKVVQAEVTKIDPANHRVETNRGPITYDYLVVSLGAVPDFNAVEGLDDSTPPWTPEKALKLRERLIRFSGGTVITGFVRPPFLCPPAPYEVAGQITCASRCKGILPKTKVRVVVPEPKPLFQMSPSISDQLLEVLGRVGVEFIGSFQIDHIDKQNKVIVGSNGEKIKYDILAIAPPFKPPKVVAESELAGKGGWMVVDPQRGFRSKKYDNVFGIGDVIAPPLNLPMAGVVAHSESGLLTSSIVASIRGASLSYGLNLYAACVMDLGATGILPFCDFTPAVLGLGPVYCGRVFEGAAVKIAKELFEAYWFTQVIPKY